MDATQCEAMAHMVEDRAWEVFRIRIGLHLSFFQGRLMVDDVLLLPEYSET
jgi:hypothetical protein